MNPRKIAKYYEKAILKLLSGLFYLIDKTITPIDRAIARIVYRKTGIKLEALRE